MTGSISLISPPIPFHPFSNSSIQNYPKQIYRSVGGSTRGRICAAGRDHDQAHHHDGSYGGGGGRLVDESMIVLRRRIHEMKVVERNYEPPSDWMEWEKEWYGSYDSVICGLMGILQSQLMDTRPSLILGILALVAVSVPTSTAIAVSYLVDMMSTVVLSGIHPPS